MFAYRIILSSAFESNDLPDNFIGCLYVLHHLRQKMAHTPLYFGIFALILFILGLVGLIVLVDTLRGIGGILFGTGLTVLISTWNNREQSAKEANLRRKTEIYGPLHAELQNLRDRLLESTTDDL